MRLALGVAYRGSAYRGWQSQPGGSTVQDHARSGAVDVRRPCRSRTVCAGRTDAGVHALNQVVHLDTESSAVAVSWVRGTQPLPAAPTSRCSGAAGRRRRSMRATARAAGATPTCCSSRRCGPALEAGLVGWTLPAARRRRRCGRPRRRWSASTTSAPSARPNARRCRRCKTLRAHRDRRAAAPTGASTSMPNAFLHHMVRNIMGCLVAVGSGARAAGLAGRGAGVAGPQRGGADLRARRPLLRRARTTMPSMPFPTQTPAMDWLP